MIEAIIIILMSLGLIGSPAEFENLTELEQQNLIVIVDIDDE